MRTLSLAHCPGRRQMGLLIETETFRWTEGRSKKAFAWRQIRPVTPLTESYSGFLPWTLAVSAGGGVMWWHSRDASPAVWTADTSGVILNRWGTVLSSSRSNRFNLTCVLKNMETLWRKWCDIWTFLGLRDREWSRELWHGHFDVGTWVQYFWCHYKKVQQQEQIEIIVDPKP